MSEKHRCLRRALLHVMVYLLRRPLRAGSALDMAERRDYPHKLYVIMLQVWTQLPHTHSHCACLCLEPAHDFNSGHKWVGLCKQLCLVC